MERRERTVFRVKKVAKTVSISPEVLEYIYKMKLDFGDLVRNLLSTWYNNEVVKQAGKDIKLTVETPVRGQKPVTLEPCFVCGKLTNKTVEPGHVPYCEEHYGEASTESNKRYFGQPVA